MLCIRGPKPQKGKASAGKTLLSIADRVALYIFGSDWSMGCYMHDCVGLPVISRVMEPWSENFPITLPQIPFLTPHHLALQTASGWEGYLWSPALDGYSKVKKSHCYWPSYMTTATGHGTWPLVFLMTRETHACVGYTCNMQLVQPKMFMAETQ